jgi:hypothetical protein
MVNVSSGSTHTITINRLQTLTVTSLFDLTGTKITSDKPLTVITGSEYAQVPPTVCCGESLYVQVPPTFNWGQVFILAPFDGREANQYYKLVTSANFTTIAYKCGTSGQGLEIQTAGSGFVISSSPNSYCYLTATSPVFVVQMAPGYQEDRMGDPAIAMVPPITGHVKTSAFTTPAFGDYRQLFFQHFITVTVRAEHFNESQVQLDGRQLNCTWNDIFNTVSEDLVGHGCTASIAAGSHIVSHTQAAGVLSVTAYGWNRYYDTGYAFLTNFKLNGTEAPSEGMTMHVRCSC